MEQVVISSFRLCFIGRLEKIQEINLYPKH